MGKNIFSKTDIQMMEEALQEARMAFAQDEVPVGAVLVHEGEIIARARNLVETAQNPSFHAELLCIQEGARALNNWRLVGCALYTTLEPCLMCAGALLLARVDRVVWGAPDIRHGAHGSYLNVFETQHPTHTLQIEGGLLKEESAKLMKDFFKKQRTKNDSVARSAL
nr:nucleoside deaminase [Candidatus Neptunochlamydia vexilliferae]